MKNFYGKRKGEVIKGKLEHYIQHGTGFLDAYATDS
jgi:hypothetical protein